KLKSLLLCFILLATHGRSAQEKLILFFDFGKEILNEASSEKLTTWLTTADSVSITKVEGYCDHIDTHTYNKDLSLRRAKAVLSVLQSSTLKNVNPEIVGFGENFEQAKVQSENRKV